MPERHGPERATGAQIGAVEVAVDLDAFDESEVPAVGRIPVRPRRLRSGEHVGEEQHAASQHRRCLDATAEVAHDGAARPVFREVRAQVGRDLERALVVLHADHRLPAAGLRSEFAAQPGDRRVAFRLGRERDDLLQERREARTGPRARGVERGATSSRSRSVRDSTGISSSP